MFNMIIMFAEVSKQRGAREVDQATKGNTFTRAESELSEEIGQRSADENDSIVERQENIPPISAGLRSLKLRIIKIVVTLLYSAC